MAANMFWSNPKGRRKKIDRDIEELQSKRPRLDVPQRKTIWGVLGDPDSPPVASASQPTYVRSINNLNARQISTGTQAIQPFRNPTATETQLSVSTPVRDKLRKPVSELPERFRCVFPYISFNHVQSLVFDTMFETNKPVVVSAPTGSGKTGVFELAIIKVIMDCERRLLDMGTAKIIYLAPTKALCSERCLDWTKKFKPFNIQCVELTSDITENVNFKNLNMTSILVATPEKWDSITRTWSGHKAFVQTIRLLLVDEVHLVNDGARGATLEAVISRMKTIRSIIWPTEQDNLRFVAASATVSNVGDIADWFSTPSSEAEVYKVDPQERPVKLKTVVIGYTTNTKSVNEFSFDNLLNHKLPDVIRDYSNGKPTLVFCATRKSTVGAANTLVREGKFDASFSTEKRNMYLKMSQLLRDKSLQETTRFGIAFHHAGLCASDRKLIETGFIDGHVMILCCTSTLAMGVNLPAHLVIIKNTMYYAEGQFKPYSESSLVQMMGRAGRPQFDVEATAVIMTKSHCRDEIEKMLTGNLVVDSQLHKFLTEHFNSEIVLGTITDDNIARKWIDATFLHVRLLKSPQNYGLDANSSAVVKEQTIIGWCKKSIDLLLRNKMVKRVKQMQLESTDAGRAMARHYICLDTMIKLINLQPDESLYGILRVICSSYEVASDMQLRQEDKPTLANLNNPKNELHRLRFHLGDKIDSREKKACALIQATLGNLQITDNSIFQESLRIMRNAGRVVKCLKDVALMDNRAGFIVTINILKLAQCLVARLWENSIYVSKQLEKIGPVLSHNLANNDMTSFESLRKANPRNIEVFCNRLPPFGSIIQQTCFGLPIYKMRIYFRSIPNVTDKIQLMVDVCIENGQDMRHQHSLPKHHECTLIVGSVRDNKLLLRHQVSDNSLLTRPDLTICYGAELSKIELPDNHDKIEGHLISSLFVGLDIQETVEYMEPTDD